MKQQRAKIFIDGSNFFYYCKDINIPSFPLFDFEKFSKELCKKTILIQKTYYIGAVRAKPSDKRAIKMMSKQMKLFSYLKKNGWIISKGYLLKSHGKCHEKGVDVKIALDIAVGAVEDTYDIGIVISSDTDLLPAIKYARSLNKKITYLGFKHQPSRAMIANCNNTKLLNKKDLKPFVSV